MGLPSYFLGSPNTSRTYSNVEQENLQLIKWSIQPIAERIEAAFSDLLVRGQTAAFKYESLLKTDTSSRYDSYAVALSNGFLTVDEVRDYENLDPMDYEEGDADPTDNDSGDLKAAMALLKKAGYKVSKSAEKESTVDRDDHAEKAGKKVAKDIEYDEKKKDGIHGSKRGAEDDKAEKAGKKVAKDIEYDEKKSKKKEKTEEAGGSGTPTASSGFSYGQGIYDSLNRDLENAITESMSQLDESMSINMSDSTEGGKSLTITASDEDALKLATLLKSAGLGGGDSEGYGGSGYKSACGCGN